MKKKKILASALTAALCVGLLAGCGSSSSTSSSSTTAASGSDASEASGTASASASSASADASGEYTLVEDGYLTWGTNAQFPPYEYYEGTEVVGIDAEIAQAVAEKLGLEAKVVDMDFSSLVTSVQSGKIDIALAGMTVTEERQQNVDFTDSYATGIQVIIVPEDSSIQSADDLADAMIGVQEATTGDIYCTDDYGEDHVTKFTNGATAVQAMLSGKVDCVVIDNEPAKAYVAENEGLKILDTPYVTEDYAAAVSKDNPGLTAAINEALQELKDDGTIQAILDKYITE